MGKTGRRVRDRENVREKILNAARELFVKEGYDAVSMRKIGARIDYSAMAPYRYFPDKESILRELCLEDFRNLRQAIDRIITEDDPIERIRQIARAYVNFALEYPHQYRLLFMTPLPREAHLEKEFIEHPEMDGYAKLKETIAEGVAAGRFREGHDDPELLSQLFWAGLHGIVSLHIVHKNAPSISWRPIRRTAEVLLDALCDGLTRTRRP